MCSGDKGITNGVAKTKTQKTDSRFTTWANSSGQNGNDRFKFLFCRWHCDILNQVHWRRPVFGCAPEVEIPVRGLKQKKLTNISKLRVSNTSAWHTDVFFFCVLGHKKRANIFHCFELENICREFVHLETERLFNNPGPKGQKCYKWLGWDKIWNIIWKLHRLHRMHLREIKGISTCHRATLCDRSFPSGKGWRFFSPLMPALDWMHPNQLMCSVLVWWQRHIFP